MASCRTDSLQTQTNIVLIINCTNRKQQEVLRYRPAIPKVHYSEGLLFQKSTVQIHATVLRFGLRLGLGLGLG